MSDKTPQEEHYGLRPASFPDDPPNTPAQDTPSFGFDDMLPARDGSPSNDSEEALMAAFRRMSGGEGTPPASVEPTGSVSQQEEALYSAFVQQSRAAEPAPASPPDRVDEVYAAFNRMSRQPEPAAAQPYGTALPNDPPIPRQSPEDMAPAVRSGADRPVQRPASAAPAERIATNRRLKPTAQQRREMAKRSRDPDPVTTGKRLRRNQTLVYDSELDEVDYTDDEDVPEVRDYLPIRFRRYGRFGLSGGLMYALVVICISIVLACLGWMFASDVLALNKDPKSAIVTIEEYVPEGDDPVSRTIDGKEVPIKVDIDQVAEELKNAGMIEYKWLFKLFSRFSNADTKIDPGTYDVSTELDYRALVTALQFGSGNQEITRITFPEGLSTAQIFALLEENHICRVVNLKEAAAEYDFDYDFLDDLTLTGEGRLEGYLFPDTYDFYQGEDAAVALNRFLRNMDNRFTKEMRQQAASMGYSVHEILTIASLIEKEAGSDDERAIMASVIYNRLNAGMPLQLDSTLNYIKGTSTFDLTYEDMEIDNPYNTYLYTGLPPGPICCPGLASIEAALNPESTDYWYWYSVDGVSTFFTNYDDFTAFAAAHPY